MPETPETVRWRAGTKVHRTIYVHEGDDPRGQIVGLMDTPELAALVVDAVNAHLARQRETPETAMRPEDVPAELVEIAEQACGQESLSRFILAAVLPAHRAMVIAEIAAEPPECVIVRRDDLETYLNRTGEELRTEIDALNRLRAALGDLP